PYRSRSRLAGVRDRQGHVALRRGPPASPRAGGRARDDRRAPCDGVREATARAGEADRGRRRRGKEVNPPPLSPPPPPHVPIWLYACATVRGGLVEITAADLGICVNVMERRAGASVFTREYLRRQDVVPLLSALS